MIFRAVLAGSKVYSVQTYDEKIHTLSKKVPILYVKENFGVTVYRNCVENNLVPRVSQSNLLFYLNKNVCCFYIPSAYCVLLKINVILECHFIFCSEFFVNKETIYYS